MEFLGEPEAAELLEYIESIESAWCTIPEHQKLSGGSGRCLACAVEYLVERLKDAECQLAMLKDKRLNMEFSASNSGLRMTNSANPYQQMNSLLDSIRAQLQALIDGLPSKDVVLKKASEAFDQYIAPLDIPGVPNIVEPVVDKMLKEMFLQLVSALYDQLQAI